MLKPSLLRAGITSESNPSSSCLRRPSSCLPFRIQKVARRLMMRSLQYEHGIPQSAGGDRGGSLDVGRSRKSLCRICLADQRM